MKKKKKKKKKNKSKVYKPVCSMGELTGKGLALELEPTMTCGVDPATATMAVANSIRAKLMECAAEAS
jgi:hypothetical protein